MWTLTSLLKDLDFPDDVVLLSSTTDQPQRQTLDLSLAAMIFYPKRQNGKYKKQPTPRKKQLKIPRSNKCGGMVV